MTMNQLLSRLGGPPPAPSAPVHFDEIGALPAGIARRPGQPGAALHDVLALVQQHAPTVTGLVVRDGVLLVGHAAPPDDAARAAVRAVLADDAALARLASRGAAPLEDLRAQLLDPTLSDDAWLRAFRRYQVAQLSGGGAT